MSGKTMLYITYIDFGEFRSGSSVRPQMMYDAFLQQGWEIKLLQTQQNQRKKRMQAVEEVISWLDENTPEFCYVESPSGPLFNRCDAWLLKKIHTMEIPLGYFYRDAAFKFDEVFIQGKKSLKQRVIAWMSGRDIRLLKKTADLIYFPTASMAKYFDFPQYDVLPPGCVGHLGDKRGIQNQRRSIYVGGVSKRYGTDTLLEAFALLNPGSAIEYPLTLVCREAEATYIPAKYRDKPWLTIRHAAGKEALRPLYEQADLGLYPIQKNAYNDFALSVKLLEYMEFGLPVVAVNSTETERFVEQFGTGLVCRDDPRDFADKVQQILGSQEEYSRYCRQVYDAVEGNRWVDRAAKVIADLTQRRA